MLTFILWIWLGLVLLGELCINTIYIFVQFIAFCVSFFIVFTIGSAFLLLVTLAMFAAG